MQDMSKRANHELSEMSLVATKPQNLKTSDNNAKTNTANLNSNANKTRVFCKDCGFKPSGVNNASNMRKTSGFGAQLATGTMARNGEGVRQRRTVLPLQIHSPIRRMPQREPSTLTGLPVGITRLSQMAIKAELFEKRYIDRDSVLLDTACFNHLFNSKRWFIEYEDIDPLSIGSKQLWNRRCDWTVRVPLLLPDGSVNALEMPNTMCKPARPCNLISTGQLEHNKVVQDGFNKTVCFKDSNVVLG
jgi:hypothetical protein